MIGLHWSNYMAQYPTFGQGIDSELIFIDQVALNRNSLDNMVEYYNYSDSITTTFSIKHTLTTEDLNTLNLFYIDNRRSTFDFYYVADDTTYSGCAFIDPPQVTIIANGFWNVISNIIQVK